MRQSIKGHVLQLLCVVKVGLEDRQGCVVRTLFNYPHTEEI